jgi:hypothetical protein
VVRGTHASLLIGVLVAAWAASGSVACVDETHEQEVAALGPEPAGVPPGPTHRPGQPCLTCHGGSGPAKTQFSLGGTVYETEGQTMPSVGSSVLIEDIEGNLWTTSPTNSAGNFFVLLSDFAPHYPTQPTVIPEDGANSISMATHIARDGSCADCHSNPAGSTSAGPVYAHLAMTQ